MIPLQRLGTSDEAVSAVHLLCPPESDRISGQTLVRECGPRM